MKKGHLEECLERPSFLFDVQTLRERVRQHIEEGAFTRGYAADRETVIKLLNEAMAIEIACVLRCEPHYFLAYADRVAERIVELGGSPNFCPDVLSKHAGYVEDDSLKDMIQEDLVAERIAIESYREMLVYTDEKDLRTRRILAELLAREEAHVEDLVSLLAGVKDREIHVSAGPAPQLRDPRPAGVVEYRDSGGYERGSTAKAGYQTAGGESRR